MESELRLALLQLKRQFVAQHVFIFNFLVLKDDTPYIFLFSEPIDRRLVLGPQIYSLLGLNEDLYRQAGKKRLEAIFISGDQYPFKTMAGYFEGEYAVVFEQLSPQPMWTAFHELGHNVENMRVEVEKIEMQRNVEVNALLFPLIFADDNLRYVRERFTEELKKKNNLDPYKQAVKGILNGSMITINTALFTPFGSQKDYVTISDNFELHNVEAALQSINRLSSPQLKSMALKVYRGQKQLLATARKGKFPAIKTNTEEIVYGTHSSAERELIVTASSRGVFGRPSNGKSRLIRDGTGSSVEKAARDMVGLMDAGITFVLVEAFILLLHVMSKRVREDKFFGRRLPKIVSHMTSLNPQTDNFPQTIIKVVEKYNGLQIGRAHV